LESYHLTPWKETSTVSAVESDAALSLPLGTKASSITALLTTKTDPKRTNMDSNHSGITTEKIGAEEAKQALKVVQQAESASLNQAMPTRWFGAAIALTIGSIVTVSASGKTELIAVSFAVLAGVLAAQKHKQGAVLKSGPNGAKGIIALIGLAVVAMALIAGAKILNQAHGYGWAPVASGALMAILIYLISLSERREYAAKIKAAAESEVGDGIGEKE
jgi:hypothetical protein